MGIIRTVATFLLSLLLVLSLLGASLFYAGYHTLKYETLSSVAMSGFNAAAEDKMAEIIQKYDSCSSGSVKEVSVLLPDAGNQSISCEKLIQMYPSRESIQSALKEQLGLVQGQVQNMTMDVFREQYTKPLLVVLGNQLSLDGMDQFAYKAFLASSALSALLVLVLLLMQSLIALAVSMLIVGSSNTLLMVFSQGMVDVLSKVLPKEAVPILGKLVDFFLDKHSMPSNIILIAGTIVFVLAIVLRLKSFARHPAKKAEKAEKPSEEEKEEIGDLVKEEKKEPVKESAKEGPAKGGPEKKEEPKKSEEAKVANEPKKTRYCRFCGGTMPISDKACPVCGKNQ